MIAVPPLATPLVEIYESAAFQLYRSIQTAALLSVSFYHARLLPICTRDLLTRFQYQSDAMFKTLPYPIHVHSVHVDHSLLMLAMFNSYFSVARTAHWCHDNGGDGRIGETVVELG